MRVRRERFRRWLRRDPAVPIYLIVLVTLVVASLAAPTFRQPVNLVNVLVQTVAMGLAGTAQTFAILAGDVDLTVGGIISLATVAAAKTMADTPQSMLLVSALILLGGGVLGLSNGFIISRVRVESMVITLAINAALFGVALHFMPYPSGMVPYRFMTAVTGQVGGLPLPVLGLGIIVAASWYVLNRTRFGVHLRAVGADPEVAFRAGIKVERVKMAAHAATGLLAALAGLFLAARMGSGDATAGGTFGLDSMTATIAGGANFSSGVGNVTGTAAGAFLIVVLGNIFNQMGISTYYQTLFKGALLVIAVAGGAVRKRWQEKK